MVSIDHQSMIGLANHTRKYSVTAESRILSSHNRRNFGISVKAGNCRMLQKKYGIRIHLGQFLPFEYEETMLISAYTCK